MKFFTTATLLSFSCNSENYLDLSSNLISSDGGFFL